MIHAKVKKKQTNKNPIHNNGSYFKTKFIKKTQNDKLRNLPLCVVSCIRLQFAFYRLFYDAVHKIVCTYRDAYTHSCICMNYVSVTCYKKGHFSLSLSLNQCLFSYKNIGFFSFGIKDKLSLKDMFIFHT